MVTGRAIGSLHTGARGSRVPTCGEYHRPRDSSGGARAAVGLARAQTHACTRFHMPTRRRGAGPLARRRARKGWDVHLASKTRIQQESQEQGPLRALNITPPPGHSRLSRKAGSCSPPQPLGRILGRQFAVSTSPQRGCGAHQVRNRPGVARHSARRAVISPHASTQTRLVPKQRSPKWSPPAELPSPRPRNRARSVASTQGRLSNSVLDDIVWFESRSATM